MIKHKKKSTFLIETTDGYALIESKLETTRGFVNGHFYIDTGSSACLISDLWISPKGRISMNVIGLDNSVTRAGVASACIHISSKHYYEQFLVVNHNCFPCTKRNIIGVLGVDFLTKHKLIVDFKHNQLYVENEKILKRSDHKNRIVLNTLRLSDGVKIPFAKIVGRNSSFTCLLDTGSNSNIITNDAITKGDFSFSVINPTHFTLISGINKDAMSLSTNVSFKIQDAKDTNDSPQLAMYSESFDVLLTNKSILTSEDGGVDIQALLGCPFLIKHECIMNFDKGIVEIF